MGRNGDLESQVWLFGKAGPTAEQWTGWVYAVGDRYRRVDVALEI